MLTDSPDVIPKMKNDLEIEFQKQMEAVTSPRGSQKLLSVQFLYRRIGELEA